MDVTLLYFDGCPSWRTADQRLRELADEIGFEVGYRKVDSPDPWPYERPARCAPGRPESQPNGQRDT